MLAGTVPNCQTVAMRASVNCRGLTGAYCDHITDLTTSEAFSCGEPHSSGVYKRGTAGIFRSGSVPRWRFLTNP
jgi:hypothetical protein